MSVFEIHNIIENAMKSGRWVIYLRKSRADLEAEKHGDGDTLQRHRAILTELAIRRGLNVVEIIEEVVSGDTIAARPGIQKLIDGAYKGQYDGILVMAVDRLSRGNQSDAQRILDMVKFGNQGNGLLVMTPSKVYDVSRNSDDEEYMEFELFMSRREYKLITRRLKYGKERCVAEGQFLGNRPYGYVVVESFRKRTLEPHPDEAPIVKLIFKWYVEENLTPTQICRRLESMGILTYTGKDIWGKETIQAILKNPVYNGKVRWYDRLTVQIMVDGEVVKKRINGKKTDKYMLYEGLHDALIDDETFAKANEPRQNPEVRAGYGLRNPLSKLIYCGKCGKALNLHYRQPGKTMTSRYRHHQDKGCPVQTIRYNDVVDAIVYALQREIDDFEVEVSNEPNVDIEEIKKQTAMYDRAIAEAQQAIDKLFVNWEKEKISDDEFFPRKATHMKRIELLESEKSKLQIDEPVEYEVDTYLFSEAIEMLKDEDIEPEIRNEFLRQFIKRIEIDWEDSETFHMDITFK